MSKCKHYSPEYRQELVELVRRTQSSCRKIALEVGAEGPNSRDSEAGALPGRAKAIIFRLKSSISSGEVSTKPGHLQFVADPA